MNNDALERLRKRERPKVSTRDTAIDKAQPKEQIEREIADSNAHLDISTPRNLDIEKPKHLDIETKQTTIRLEVALSQRLTQSANGLGVCREALLEALFEYWEDNSAVKEVITQAALEKHELRQQVANYRRAQSMMKKFGGH